MPAAIASPELRIRTGDNMKHFIVPVAEKRSRIDFKKVKKVQDVVLILESLGMVFATEKVPASIAHLVVPIEA